MVFTGLVIRFTCGVSSFSADQSPASQDAPQPWQTRMVGQPFSKCRGAHIGCPKQCLPPPGKGPEQQQASGMLTPPQPPHPVPSCAAEPSTRLGPAEGPQQAGRQGPSTPFITQPSVRSPPPHTALFKSHSL